MLGKWEGLSSDIMKHCLQYFFSTHLPSPSGRLFPSCSLFPPIMRPTVPKPVEQTTRCEREIFWCNAMGRHSKSTRSIISNPPFLVLCVCINFGYLHIHHKVLGAEMLHRVLSLDAVSGDGWNWGKSTRQIRGCPEVWEQPLCCHSRCFPMCPLSNSLHRRLGWRGALAGMAQEGQTREVSPRAVWRLEGGVGAFANRSEGWVTVPVLLPVLWRVPRFASFGLPLPGTPESSGVSLSPGATAGHPQAPPGWGSRAGQAFPRTPVPGWSGGIALCPLTAAPRGTLGMCWHGDPRGKGGLEHIWASPWRDVRDSWKTGEKEY